MDWQAVTGLFLLAVIIFYLSRLVAPADQRHPESRKQLLFYGGMVLILFIFGIGKYPFFAHLFSLKQPLALVGISYFTFKLIHFFVDVRQSAIERPKLLTFLNFMFFFPAFLSGPIDRYENFSTTLEASKQKRMTSSESCLLLTRFAVGLFKKLVIASAFSSLSIASMDLETIPHQSRLRLIGGIYTYALYVFFDFSGYSDMAVSTARLIGLNVPENFNFPYTSLSIQEFWNRYHITLSEWIRDYLFYPMLRFFLNVAPMIKATYLSFIAVTIAFALSGVWHGGSLHFLLFGLCHGISLGIFALYSDYMKKNHKKKYQALRAAAWYRAGCWLLTINLVILFSVLFSDKGFVVLNALFAGGGK